MEIITLPVGSLKANCYLLIDRNSREAIIIDSGDDPDLIVNKILDLNLKCKLILATHGHFDHILAALELQLVFKVPFLMSDKDEFLLGRMQSSAKHFLGINVGPPPKIGNLKIVNSLKIGNLKLKILETPGHTPGSVCFYSKKDKAIFTGDTLISGREVGRTDFKYSDNGKLQKSITKILKLPVDTIIYPGHGNPTTVGECKIFFT